MLDNMATAPLSLTCFAIGFMDHTACSPPKSTDCCYTKQAGAATQGLRCAVQQWRAHVFVGWGPSHTSYAGP